MFSLIALLVHQVKLNENVALAASWKKLNIYIYHQLTFFFLQLMIKKNGFNFSFSFNPADKYIDGVAYGDMNVLCLWMYWLWHWVKSCIWCAWILTPALFQNLMSCPIGIYFSHHRHSLQTIRIRFILALWDSFGKRNGRTSQNQLQWYNLIATLHLIIS